LITAYLVASVWADSTPFRSTKPIGSHFCGTRNPMAISSPKRIRPGKTPRARFHHVKDIAPTV
jgi:arylsulfatase